MKKQGRSIFHTIFLAMLSVLFIETLLLLIVLYLSRVGERLNQNAIDPAFKSRSKTAQLSGKRHAQDNQNLSSLSDKINTGSGISSGIRTDRHGASRRQQQCLPSPDGSD